MPLTNVAAATQILANAMKALDSLREQSKGSKDISLKENISKLYDSLLDLKAAVLRVDRISARDLGRTDFRSAESAVYARNRSPSVFTPCAGQ